MNVFFYELLRKSKALGGSIIAFGILILLGGCYLSSTETAVDRLASFFTGDPRSEDVIELGVTFILAGLICNPLRNFIMSALEKSFTQEEKLRLSLIKSECPAPASIPVPPPITEPVQTQQIIAQTVENKQITIPVTAEETLAPQKAKKAGGTYWFSIPSLALGIFTGMALFDTANLDMDTYNGMMTLSLIGVSLGIIAVKIKAKGLKMAVTGILLNSIVLIWSLYNIAIAEV